MSPSIQEGSAERNRGGKQTDGHYYYFYSWNNVRMQGSLQFTVDIFLRGSSGSINAIVISVLNKYTSSSSSSLHCANKQRLLFIFKLIATYSVLIGWCTILVLSLTYMGGTW